MSDSENQGAWRESVVNDGTKFIVRTTPNWKPGDFPEEDFTFEHLQALEATITTLKAQLEAAEGKAVLADRVRMSIVPASSNQPPFVSDDMLWTADWRAQYDALSAPASDTGSEEGNEHE